MTVGCNAGVKAMTENQYYVGAITSVSAGNLVATGQFATAAGWSASYIGYTVQNLQTLAEATITGKTDDNTLTLSADIFTTAGQWFWIKGVAFTYSIPVFFGLEHLYGEIWEWVSGVNIEVSAEVANGGTGLAVRPTVATKVADFTLADTEGWVINDKPAATCTVTLPAASAWAGRAVTFKNLQLQTLVSASSNVVPLIGGAAGTAILPGLVGAWATLVSDGTNWVVMAS